LLVYKRSALGCSVFPSDIPDSLDAGISGQGFGVEIFKVLGAGDAFMAGFRRSWLRDESLSTCCAWANACGAIVVSRHGCLPAVATWEELQAFLQRKQRPFRLRKDAALEHPHWTRSCSHTGYYSICMFWRWITAASLSAYAKKSARIRHAYQPSKHWHSRR